MNKEMLKKMLESVQSKVQEAFKKMLETASDEDVKKFENLLKQAKDLEEQLDNIEALEEKEDLDGKGVPGKIQEGSKKTLSEREKFGKALVEAVSKGTTFSGLLPRECAQNIQRKKEELARLRGICTVHQANGEYTVMVEGSDVVVDYIDEAGTFGDTTPSIAPIGLQALKLGALTKISEEYIADLGVDVMGYIEDKFAKAFAKKEDHEILFGTGTSSSKTKIRDTAILTLFLGTGIRISELVGLNNESIDFSTNSFLITRKGGNQAVLYFSEEVGDALAAYLAQKEEDPRVPAEEHALFLSMQYRRITVRAVENLVKKYAKTVSPLKKITPHKLRSTYGTSLYRETGDIYIVADVLGHKDVNTTRKHYAAITEDHRKSVASAVHLRGNKKDSK